MASDSLGFSFLFLGVAFLGDFPGTAGNVSDHSEVQKKKEARSGANAKKMKYCATHATTPWYLEIIHM